jgi:hypothetical protein
MENVMTGNRWDFEVKRANLRERRVQPALDPAHLELTPGQVLFAVEKLALTANNVTYAALGEALGYWQFFPAAPDWGRVPAWGYARAVRSEKPDISVGERVFGYLPMSTHVVMNADQALPGSFVDAAPHRQHLPSPYNTYQRLSAMAQTSSESEDMNALFRPLYVTSFLLDDLLAERGLLKVDAIVLTSASSKTAAGLAFLLHRRSARPRIIGLTSERNVSLVASMDTHDEVLPYARIADLARIGRCVLVDFAGNRAIVSDVRRALGATLVADLRVGATHWEQGRAAATEPGPAPEVFFAPERIRVRIRDWGPQAFDARYWEAWSSFAAAARRWHSIVHQSGAGALDVAFGELVEGRSDAARSVIWSPQ